MARPAGAFHIEAAGSLTPELEGRETSAVHPRRDLPRRDKDKSSEGRSGLERH